MTTKIKGTEGVEFPDASTQGTAADAGPAFNVYQTVLQAIPLQTATKVVFDAKLFDTANAFDLVNDRFQPTVAGYYQLTAGVANNIATNAQSSQIFFRKNGVTVASGSVAIGDGFNASQCTAMGLVYLNGTTDYVELVIFATAVTNTTPLQQSTFFSGFLARRAAP